MPQEAIQQKPGRDPSILRSEAILSAACAQLGWGWGGAEIKEVHDILSPCRELDKAGVADVWKKAVQYVAGCGWSSPDYLVEVVTRYATGMVEGRYRLWPQEPGFANENEQGAYILSAAEKLEAAWKEIQSGGQVQANPKHALEKLACVLEGSGSPEAQKTLGTLARLAFACRLRDEAVQAQANPPPPPK